MKVLILIIIILCVPVAVHAVALGGKKGREGEII